MRDLWTWVGLAPSEGAPIVSQSPREQAAFDRLTAPNPKVLWALSYTDHRRGYVRPLRYSYTHLVCAGDTTMSTGSAEMWARHPFRHPTTWCCHCKTDCEVDEFVWVGSCERVGS